VPFRMRRKMLAPINTVKHYVHNSKSTILSGTVANQPIVVASVAPAVSNAFDVREGAVVKAVYVERWLISEGTSVTSQFTLTIEKKRVAEADMTFTQSQNLGAYPNKKNILYTTQGILPAINGGPTVPVIRQYVLIPKGKQRFGAGDELVVNIAVIIDSQACGIATFKEYI